jgi:prepilin-type processing-associated H-X9-DG protein
MSSGAMGGMSGGGTGSTGQSMVSACDVTNCTYNRSNQCHAGAINVAFVDGMAHCATYTPTGSAMGVGSSTATGTGATQGMGSGGMSDDMSSGSM